MKLVLIMFNEVLLIGQQQEMSISYIDLEATRGAWGRARGVGIDRLEVVVRDIAEDEVPQGGE